MSSVSKLFSAIAEIHAIHADEIFMLQKTIAELTDKVDALEGGGYETPEEEQPLKKETPAAPKRFIPMNTRCVLTDNCPVTRKQMKQVKTEPQSLYLLESMIACYERDGYYTRNSSYKWMIDPQNNKNNYSVKNLKNAWNRALSKTAGARIPDFPTYFTLFV